ncbi:DUF4242 domain-containing protein [Peredibacter starrii]|uniref:DUF4242 domain-containing protein n=1 Tax=Peredibacter starrii TaxID=28202 RepID=A0AAX4HMG3_9BACT|nr:DUF4242 domain-containing protein [Peredibacter starrii]WPU64308.1 DUF4242 domain-containing protein [Peredibacter starrii]
MKKFLVERNIPDLGKNSEDEFQNPDSHVEWKESIVTADKVFCVYEAENEEAVRVHVMQGNLPVNRISEIKTVLTPESEHMRFRVPDIEKPIDRLLT